MRLLLILGLSLVTACTGTAKEAGDTGTVPVPSGSGSSGSGSSGTSEADGLYAFENGILTISHVINPFPGESVGLFGLGTGVEDGLQNAAATIVPTGEGDLPVNLGLYGNTSILWTLGTLKDGTTLDDLLWRSSAIADTLADGDTLGLTVWSDVYGESRIFFCTRVTSEGVMPGECALLIEEAGGSVDTGGDSGGGGSGTDDSDDVTDTDSGDTSTDSGSFGDTGTDSVNDVDTAGDPDTESSGGADTSVSSDSSDVTDTSGSSTDTSIDSDTGISETGGSDTGSVGDSDDTAGDTGDSGGSTDETVFDEGDFGTTEASTCDTDPFVRSDGYPLFAYDDGGVCGIYLPGYGSEAEPDASADLTLTGYEIGQVYSATLEVLNTSSTDSVTFVADFGGEALETLVLDPGEAGSLTLTWEAATDEATLRVWTTSTSSWEYDGVLTSYLIEVGESDTSSDTGSGDTGSGDPDTGSSDTGGDIDSGDVSDTGSMPLDTGALGTDSGIADTGGDTGDTGTDSINDVDTAGDPDTESSGGADTGSSDSGSFADTGTDSAASDTGSMPLDTGSIGGGDTGSDTSIGDTAGGDSSGDTGSFDTSSDTGSSESESIVYESVFVADEGEELSECVTTPFVRSDSRPLFAYDEDGVCGVYLPGDGSEIEPLTDAELSLTGYVLGVTYTAIVQVYNDSSTDSVTFVADFGGQRPETLTLAAGESGELTLTWEADDTNGTLRVWTTSSSRWSYDGVMTGFVIEY